MTRHLKLLTMMTRERNGRVYNVIGQSKAPYKLAPHLRPENIISTDDYNRADDHDDDIGD